jgi:rhombotail lipoprotein
MKSFKVVGAIVLGVAVLFLMAGCALQDNHNKSSVVEYLYPEQQGVIVQPETPLLGLPLRVGVAFVPEGGRGRGVLTERDKMELMKEVSDYFKKYDFIKTIELIPSAYLTPKGSFTNLNQIQNMYGIDVIALLSFDQTQFTDEGLMSITYWTLVGAYVVPGEKNDTHTMVDAAVYDIWSKKMLFRAPGISRIKSHATPVNLAEQKRLDSQQGFAEASKDLVSNLEIQLELFKEKVQESPADYQVVHKPGYTGGSSLDLWSLLLLLAFGGLMLCGSRKHAR